MATTSPIFQNVFRILEKYGIIDVVLPFLLVFAIIYAILQKSKIFKKKDTDEADKKTNTIVSLVISVLFIVPHLTGAYETALGFDPVDAVLTALPSFGLILIGIVLFGILAGLLGVWQAKTWKRWTAFIGLILIAYVFYVSIPGTGGRAPGFLNFLNDPDIQTLIIIILIFAVLVAFITAEEPEEGKEHVGKRFIDYLFNKEE